MVIRIPKFKAVSSGDQTWIDIFKQGGYMFQLWQLYKPVIFDCLDFVMAKNDQAEMICAVKEDVEENDVALFILIDFFSGLYAMAVSIDDDDESIQKVQDKIYQWIERINFELDSSRDFIFNMPYLYEDIKI